MRMSKKAKRNNLYILRCKHQLTQAEIAAKIGVSRLTYSYVEQGERSGNQAFWEAIQRIFNVPDEEMYSLQKVEQEMGV